MTIRLVTWNCRISGFRTKAQYMAALRPDVLAVQEVEPLESGGLFAGECQPTFTDRRGDPTYPRRAIGMFSYTDTQFTVVDALEPMPSFRRYEVHHGGRFFNVVAVWPCQTNSSKTAYRQAHDGLSVYAKWIEERPTIILGDFNANASFSGNNWKQLLALLERHGLVSAYHHHFNEAFGQETRPTYFHRGSVTSPFHLDYCFLPTTWASHIKLVEVGRYADWHGRSDHAPLVVDLDL